MKVNILISDENGFVLDDFIADNEGTGIDTEERFAGWLRDIIEKHVNTEDSE